MLWGRSARSCRSPTTSAPPVDLQRDAVRRLERAGYRAAWTNEVIGKDALVQLAVPLAATEKMAFGSGIANIWARSPQTTHGAAALLAQAYPGRLVLGLGVGYPEQAASVGREHGTPLATIRDYLEQMTGPTQLPAPDAAYSCIIAANGPKMLTLAGEITDGALPAMVQPDFTAQARRLLGHLLVQCGFQDILGEQLQQAVRAGQRQPSRLRLGHHRHRSSLLGRQLPRRLPAILAWTHKIRCHHSQCPSRRTSARRVGPKTPILKQSQEPDSSGPSGAAWDA